jgi:hypothetical protein
MYKPNRMTTTTLLRKFPWRSYGILQPQLKLRSYSIKRRSFDDSSHRPKVTLDTLRQMYLEKEKIVSLTAYDFPSATFADRAGCDIVLVGDSLGMVCLGYEGTNQVTLSVKSFAIAKADANRIWCIIRELSIEH